MSQSILISPCPVCGVQLGINPKLNLMDCPKCNTRLMIQKSQSPEWEWFMGGMVAGMVVGGLLIAMVLRIIRPK